MTEPFVEEFLSHYGVKGMKWGVRKNEKGGTTGSGGLSPAQATVAAYGAIIVGLMLAQKSMMYRDSGRKDAKKMGDKEFKKNPELAKPMSVDALHSQVSKPINPGYGAPGTKMNCRRATFAYEMRRRGYDVKATKSKYASGQDLAGLKTAAAIGPNQRFESVWGQTRVYSPVPFNSQTPQQKADQVFNSLKQNPNGARGEVGVAWTMGGGHSMSYEIVKNKPVIFDNQNGKVYKTAKEFSSFTPVVLQAAHTRLDNQPLNQEHLKRWVANV